MRCPLRSIRSNAAAVAPLTSCSCNAVHVRHPVVRAGAGLRQADLPSCTLLHAYECSAIRSIRYGRLGKMSVRLCRNSMLLWQHLPPRDCQRCKQILAGASTV